MLSRKQFEEVDAPIAEINEKITSLKNGIKLGSPRLKKLHDAGFHIESIWLNGQLLEHALKQLICSIELYRKVASIAELADPYPRMKEFKNLEKQPLGEIIKLLSDSVDKKFLKSLEDFNEIRKEIVHHVFDGTRNIEENDAKAVAYTTSVEFSEMLIKLSAIQGKIQTETQALYD